MRLPAYPQTSETPGRSLGPASCAFRLARSTPGLLPVTSKLVVTRPGAASSARAGCSRAATASPTRFEGDREDRSDEGGIRSWRLPGTPPVASTRRALPEREKALRRAYLLCIARARVHRRREPSGKRHESRRSESKARRRAGRDDSQPSRARARRGAVASTFAPAWPWCRVRLRILASVGRGDRNGLTATLAPGGATPMAPSARPSRGARPGDGRPTASGAGGYCPGPKPCRGDVVVGRRRRCRLCGGGILALRCGFGALALPVTLAALAIPLRTME